MGVNLHYIDLSASRSTTVVTLCKVFTNPHIQNLILYDIPLFPNESTENWQKLGYHVGIQILDMVVEIKSVLVYLLSFNT